MKKVLFIDDDASLTRVYHQRLSAEGYEVISAATAEDGLKILETNQPDLVVLDIMLPGAMSGMDLLEKIKRDYKLNKIPTIMLSNIDSHMVKSLELGATWYFVKANSSLDEVIKKVKSIIG
ncbi:response regulator [Candidatus Gottesmanbacteria bacterium]|nr:response regulator [Candidatus Gottesmanbacteria bacterium]